MLVNANLCWVWWHFDRIWGVPATMSIKMVLINSALRILQVPHTPNNRRSNGLVSPKWTNMKIYMEITSSITTKLQRFPKQEDLLFLFATKKMARKKKSRLEVITSQLSVLLKWSLDLGAHGRPNLGGWKVARISMPGEYLFISNNVHIFHVCYCILYIVYIYIWYL